MSGHPPSSILKIAALGALLLTGLGPAGAADLTLTHAVGYHSDSGVVHALAEEFERRHRERSGQDVSVQVVLTTMEEQLHRLQDGTLQPDVISTAGRSAMDVIAGQLGIIPGNWDDLLPNSASPYATAVVLMVRPGNPLNIRDWDDLARADVALVASSPRSSGFARSVYVNLCYYAWLRYDGDDEQIREFLRRVYDPSVVLTENGAASLLAFESGSGDVMPIWECEMLRRLAAGDDEPGEYVIMPVSIMNWPRLAIAADHARDHGVEELAHEYINFIYSEAGQQVVASHYMRPSHHGVLREHEARYFTSLPVNSTLASDIYNSVSHDFEDGGWFDLHLKAIAKQERPAVRTQ